MNDDIDPTVVTCEGMARRLDAREGAVRSVCRHGHVMGETPCKVCLGPDDWRVQTFVEGRWQS